MSHLLNSPSAAPLTLPIKGILGPIPAAPYGFFLLLYLSLSLSLSLSSLSLSLSLSLSPTTTALVRMIEEKKEEMDGAHERTDSGKCYEKERQIIFSFFQHAALKATGYMVNLTRSIADMKFNFYSQWTG
jgi:hypothetical protein